MVKRHITYSNVVVSLALVFAMSGGAYAASKHLIVITSTKQISPKVLKALKGANGKTGANGAQGPAGPAGAAGPSGPQGPAGEPGKEGPPGPKGENGKDGATGFTETLPSGKTLKGDWAAPNAEAQGPGFEGASFDIVSFGIPLSTAPVAVHVVPAPTEEEEQKGEFPAAPQGCTGDVTNPGAEAGNLCVFAREKFNVSKSKICPTGGTSEGALHCVLNGGAPEAADPYGFSIYVEAETKSLMAYSGTWAVTAA
jgi:hypothetical protein